MIFVVLKKKSIFGWNFEPAFKIESFHFFSDLADSETNFFMDKVFYSNLKQKMMTIFYRWFSKLLDL